jgi:hypothetical protein
VNQFVGGSGNGTTDYQDVAWKMINILLNGVSVEWTDMTGAAASAPAPMTAVMFADGSASAPSATPWPDRTKCVFAPPASNHAWALLGNALGASSPAQFCFELTNNNGISLPLSLGAGTETSGSAPNATQQGGFFVSHTGGMTSGIAARRPYCSDEIQLGSKRGTGGQYTWMAASSSTTTWYGRMHVMRTLDGSCTRIIVYLGGIPIFFLWLDTPDSPFVTNGSPNHTWNVDDTPFYGGAIGGSSGAMLYTGGSVGWFTDISSNLGSRIASKINPTAKSVQPLGLVCAYSSATGVAGIVSGMNAANDGDGGYTPVPIGLCCGSSGYRQAKCGTCPDIYFVPSILNEGDYADDLTNHYSWRVMGDFLLPWDTSTLLVT